jgi:hypothetical protein
MVERPKKVGFMEDERVVSLSFAWMFADLFLHVNVTVVNPNQKRLDRNIDRFITYKLINERFYVGIYYFYAALA